jgi:hypothetical protein
MHETIQEEPPQCNGVERWLYVVRVLPTRGRSRLVLSIINVRDNSRKRERKKKNTNESKGKTEKFVVEELVHPVRILG